MAAADDGSGKGRPWHADQAGSQPRCTPPADTHLSAAAGPYFMAAASLAEYHGMLSQQQNAAALQYKRCNCKKAKCLKLYCVCFAAGAYGCGGCKFVETAKNPRATACCA